MKAITFEEFGTEKVMHLAEATRPKIRPGDLLVRVGAAGVNRADLLERAGFYGREKFGDSPLLGREIAGQVVAVGKAVRDVRPGDRVMGIVAGGAYAEYARIDCHLAVPVPEGMPYVEAAAIPEAFIAAFEAVSHCAGVGPGMSVLVHAAATGIGCASVQTARVLGARVFGTTAAALAPQIIDLGAEMVFDDSDKDFHADIFRHTDGAGVHAVVSLVGGDHLARSLRSLRAGGCVVQVGLLSGQPNAFIPLEVLLHRHLRVIGTMLRFRTIEDKREMVRRFSHHLLPLFAAGRLRPVIAAIFPLSEAAAAHRYMQDGGSLGKIVLSME